jgi:sporulation protein YqfC
VGRGTRRRVAHWLDLPEEVLLEVPRVELVGHLQLRLTNHRGLVRFDRDEVVVRLPEGRLVVAGTALVIGWVDHEDLLITGRIQRLAYEGLPS